MLIDLLVSGIISNLVTILDDYQMGMLRTDIVTDMAISDKFITGPYISQKVINFNHSGLGTGEKESDQMN